MSIRKRNIKDTHRDTFIIKDYQASTIASKIIGIVPVDCELVSVKEVHVTAGNHASAVTLNIEKLRHTETSGGGNSLLSSGINLKGTASTVQTGTLITTARIKTSEPFVIRFTAGDRVGVVLTGDSQTLAGMVVSLEFRPIEGGIIVSHSPSASISPSVSASPSLSPSKSTSPSASKSPSQSPSLSPSVSQSPSISPSLSPSSSVSPSRSPSASPSISPSMSPSMSPSVSPSISPSSSESPSTSPSRSLSPSSSESPSVSPSRSQSPSVSPSVSPSSSVSPSVSPS